MLKNELIEEKYGKNGLEQYLSVQNFSKAISDESDFEYSDQVAEVLVGLKLDIDSVCAGYLCPAIKKIDQTQLEKYPEIKKLISSILLVKKYSANYTDPNGLKEMLIAIAKDIRVIIIEIADILVQARKFVKDTNNNYAIKLFKVIEDIYSPIAASVALVASVGLTIGLSLI